MLMVTKKTTTKKKTPAKAAPKKAVRKQVRAKASKKVDYYPNRMTFAISALAATLLLLLALIVTFNQY